MIKDDIVIAALMQKVVLDDKEGIFLYRVVGIMDDGKLDKETDTFLDYKTDNNYFSIESDIAVLSDTDYFYGFPVSKRRLEKDYPDLEEKDRVIEYYDELNRYVYFGIFDAKKDGIKLVQVWKEALQKMEIEASMKEFSVIADKETPILNRKNQKDVKSKETTKENKKDVKSKEATKENKKEDKGTSPRINIASAYKEMKKSIIGQDEAIRKVLTAIHTNDMAKDSSYRCRCLIVGKTGCGKTEILRNLAKIVNRPFVRTDSTQITVAGYVGGSIEDNVIMPLMIQAGGDIELAQRGIVSLDEIDKKGSSNNGDISGRGVLNSFLPFLDGTQYPINFKGQKYMFDTSYLGVLACGAFSNVFDYYQKKMGGIGFIPPTVNKKEIEIEDFIKIGLIPDEFMGRFPILVLMNDLSEHDHETLLTDSETSPLRFYEKLFYREYNISLKYYDNFIKSVAQKAYQHKLGARALQKIIEQVLEECKWEIMFNGIHNKELILTEETVENPKKFILK